jgi:hypothetical protein
LYVFCMKYVRRQRVMSSMNTVSAASATSFIRIAETEIIVITASRIPITSCQPTVRISLFGVQLPKLNAFMISDDRCHQEQLVPEGDFPRN